MKSTDQTFILLWLLLLWNCKILLPWKLCDSFKALNYKKWELLRFFIVFLFDNFLTYLFFQLELFIDFINFNRTNFQIIQIYKSLFFLNLRVRTFQGWSSQQQKKWMYICNSFGKSRKKNKCNSHDRILPSKLCFFPILQKHNLFLFHVHQKHAGVNPINIDFFVFLIFALKIGHVKVQTIFLYPTNTQA